MSNPEVSKPACNTVTDLTSNSPKGISYLTLKDGTVIEFKSSLHTEYVYGGEDYLMSAFMLIHDLRLKVAELEAKVCGQQAAG